MNGQKFFAKIVITGLTILMVIGLSAYVYLDAAAAPGQYMEGTWLATSTTPGRPASLWLWTFSIDGGIVAVSDAHLTRTPALGGWVRTGDREFDVTLVRFLVDNSGKLTGTMKVRAHIPLDESLNEFDTEGIVETFDVEGKLVDSFNGAWHATRLQVEAPE